MNVSVIRGYSSPKLNFNGHWESKSKEKYIGYFDGEVRTYIPDEKESLRSIALAWEKETGDLPIDWVRKNNPYNQSESKIEYRINGSAYMPIEVLEESVKLKADMKGHYPIDNIKMYTELAKLSAQKGSKLKVQCYEQKMIEEFKDLPAPKLQEMAAFDMDKYKPGFGTDIKYKVRYNRI